MISYIIFLSKCKGFFFVAVFPTHHFFVENKSTFLYIFLKDVFPHRTKSMFKKKKKSSLLNFSEEDVLQVFDEKRKKSEKFPIGQNNGKYFKCFFRRLSNKAKELFL